ncbi:MAG: rRNA maturation RNase YbeY [Thiohalobacterales bacterium]|nr:rRNA maturation RNase YbeY [Thiohalobacterales bacterium]
MTAVSDIDVQLAVSAEGVPESETIRRWAQAVLDDRQAAGELVIRIVDEAEITALNRRYRGKDGATNVLSFPAELAPEIDAPLIGDIVICAPVVAGEAVVQDKSPEAHWAHMVIHGVLHLLGYDHQVQEEARRMEACEVRLLAALGFADPYREMA